jgi:hypothetical protein
MPDLLALIVMLAVVLATLGLVALCERLREA